MFQPVTFFIHTAREGRYTPYVRAVFRVNKL